MNADNNPLIQTKEDQENLDFVLKLKAHSKNFMILLSRSENKRLRDWISLKTPLLQDKNYTLWTKLYWIVHGLTDFPPCPFATDQNCELGYDSKSHGNVPSFDKGYFRACTAKCPRMRRVAAKKIAETTLKKYGSTNFFSSEAGKKAKAEWCKKNGVENPFQLESIKEKSKATRKSRFGYEYTMQSPEKRKLASENYKQKTGYAHQFYDPNVKQKSNETLAAHKASNLKNGIKSKASLHNRRKRYKQFERSDNIIPLFSREEFLELDDKTQYIVPLKWKCKHCGKTFESPIDQNFSSRNHIPARCLTCFPILAGTSAPEKDIAEFLENICKCDVVKKDRKILKPYELDIYVPAKHLAIEYDGLYWHSDNDGKNKKKHLLKTECCQKHGIQLIHIFEPEWIFKKDLVKSRIKNLCGIYDTCIFARKCVVKDVSLFESKQFQNENHLQGAVNSSVSLGLFYDEMLISIMTFGKSRFDKTHEWEMLRFCSKLGFHVPGAAGKLLAYFEKTYQPKSLVTYADRRWSQGKLYHALGFSLLHESAPNYWYFKNTSLKLESRVKYQKHKLSKILEKYDPLLTEAQNMHANGFNRIFDCGNLVFEKTY